MISDSRLEKRNGGGCAALFGLPFFAVGCLVISLPFWAKDAPPLLFALPFGAIFAAVGGSILFYRGGVTLDKATGKASKWGGFLARMWSKEFPLDQFAQVTLTQEVRRSNKSTYTVYPVRLVGGETVKLDFSEERSLSKARQHSEDLAKFMRLPIQDSSEGVSRLRPYESLDETVAQRFRKGAETNEIPPTPQGMKSTIDYDGTTLRVSIPPTGLKLPHYVMIGVALLFDLFIVFGFVLPIAQEVPDPGRLPVLAFVAVIALAPLLVIGSVVIGAARGSQELTVTRDRIEFKRGGLRSRPKTIRSEALEELFLTNLFAGRPGAGAASSRLFAQGGVILARSDEVTLQIGAGLSQEELAYLLALAKATLVS